MSDGEMVEYTGRRDPRLVAVHRGGLLDLDSHRLIANWAADCTEHVLGLFTAEYPTDDRPRRAIEIARAWSRGEATVGEAREAASACHAAARNAADMAAAAAARAAGHAVATAHMAEHELGAAGYAIKSVKLAAGASKSEKAAMREQQWQREQLPDAIRELVLSDQENRKVKFTSIYAGF